MTLLSTKFFYDYILGVWISSLSSHKFIIVTFKTFVFVWVRWTMFSRPMCILVVGGYWFRWTSHRWTNLNRWSISFLSIMIFQGTCQFFNCVSFSTIVYASLQVLLSLCLVYKSWNNIRSILLFCNNLCKLVFRRFANITILGAGLSTYVEVCLWVRVMIYWCFL